MFKMKRNKFKCDNVNQCKSAYVGIFLKDPPVLKYAQAPVRSAVYYFILFKNCLELSIYMI